MKGLTVFTVLLLNIGISTYEGAQMGSDIYTATYGALMGFGKGVLDLVGSPGAEVAREENLKRAENIRANLGVYEWFIMESKERERLTPKLDNMIKQYEERIDVLNKRIINMKDNIYRETNENASLRFISQTKEEIEGYINSFNEIIDYAKLIKEINSDPKESKNIIDSLVYIR